MPVGGSGGDLAAVRLAYAPVGGGAAITREVAVAYSVTAPAEQVTSSAVPAYVVAADRARKRPGPRRRRRPAATATSWRPRPCSATSRPPPGPPRRPTGADRAAVDALLEPLRRRLRRHRPRHRLDPGRQHRRLRRAPRRRPPSRPVDPRPCPALSADRLRLLRNAAYARHGYPFKSSDLQDYFRSTRWYVEDRGFSPARLEPGGCEQRRHPQDLGAARLPRRGHRAQRQRPHARRLRGPRRAGSARDDPRRARPRGPVPRAACVLRNAACTRHGYRFRATDLRDFFSQRPWYRPDPGLQRQRPHPRGRNDRPPDQRRGAPPIGAEPRPSATSSCATAPRPPRWCTEVTPALSHGDAASAAAASRSAAGRPVASIQPWHGL
ncbi:MAG: YARHG domain-containing protein [bacterium]